MPGFISLGTAYPIYMYLVHFKEIKCTVCKLRIKFLFLHGLSELKPGKQPLSTEGLGLKRLSEQLEYIGVFVNKNTR